MLQPGFLTAVGANKARSEVAGVHFIGACKCRVRRVAFRFSTRHSFSLFVLGVVTSFASSAVTSRLSIAIGAGLFCGHLIAQTASEGPCVSCLFLLGGKYVLLGTHTHIQLPLPSFKGEFCFHRCVQHLIAQTASEGPCVSSLFLLSGKNTYLACTHPAAASRLQREILFPQVCATVRRAQEVVGEAVVVAGYFQERSTNTTNFDLLAEVVPKDTGENKNTLKQLEDGTPDA